MYEFSITFMVLSVVLFLFSYMPFIRERRNQGLVYVILFRVFAALLFFVGYSISVVPVLTTITTACKGTGTESLCTQTSTVTLPDAISASLGYFVVIYILMLIASILIDIIMARKEKE
jgi:hypothetical protein